ncbi:MAG: VIT and VWA domain-containing protein [Myxococcales bacterium]
MRTVLAFLMVAMIGVVGGVPGAHAGEQLGADKTRSPYFFVEGGARGGEGAGAADLFPLKSTDVVANVSGVIADVVVRQLYENRGSIPLNARYVFPGSTRAAVHGMRFRIADKAVVATIKERQQAAREFEQAKAARKSASLLQQERPNVFTMSLANVLPGDEVEVELRYSELLVPTDGTYEFVYPTVVGPRYAKDAAPQEGTAWVSNPYLHAGQAAPSKVSIKVNLSAGMPVTEMRSPSHEVRATIAWEDSRSSPSAPKSVAHSVARVSLESVAGDRDFVLHYRLAGGAIQSGLLLYEGGQGGQGGQSGPPGQPGQENFFLLTVQPPARVVPAAIAPREYIFVLDVSGSMRGFPLDTAKRLMASLFARLRPTDTFNVVLFSGASRVLAPASLPATAENVKDAFSAIDGETGGGGTEMEAALTAAMRLPRTAHVSRSVIVVTDGYIAEERGAFALIDGHLQDTNVFAFGIGSSVNRHLIDGIAHAGRGEPFVVTSPAEAAAAAERFGRYIESPVMTEVHVAMRGFDAYDVEPHAQPDLFAARPVVVFGKWRGPKQGQIVVTGQTPAGPFTKTIDVATTDARPEHGALPQLWARTRIARLSDFAFQDDDREAVREVTTLGLTYSLLTRHTSFVAVIEPVRNPGGKAAQANQPSPLPAGVSDLAVAEESYASGAEPSFYLLLALCAATLLVIRHRRTWC